MARFEFTGSQARANQRFEQLRDFAAETPFSLQETTQAFIRLKALGLDPSIESLRAYGNVSAGIGTSITQFSEAVADATVGEFERLREFGIRARDEGERVAFTFRGTTTRIRGP